MDQTIKNFRKHHSAGKIVFWVTGGIVAAVFFAAVFAIAVTYLWNWLMPAIFGLTTITYLQAFGLIVLARLLVGGWHKEGHDDNKYKNKFQHFIRKKKRDYPDRPDFNEMDFQDYWEKEGKKAFKRYMEEKSGSIESK